MININYTLKAEDLRGKLSKFWDLSGEKVNMISREYDHSKGSPVFTVKGKYSTKGWTEWTQGFEFGSAILQFDAKGGEEFLNYGRQQTVQEMATHISHIGVHDHGFNNISTYGNLLRLMKEEKISFNEWEKNFYELA
ncbi:MAG: glycosyl hydrolase, partial [Cyclobacteriaceae bacterium]|nr:glycosyl hydrolase [Cyclobacteriaceae bacterium]